MVIETLKKELNKKAHAKLYYLRTSHGVEVDLIIDRKSYKELLEIKVSETFKPKVLAGIEQLIEGNNQGYLLYRGKETLYLDNIKVISYSEHFLRVCKKTRHYFCDYLSYIKAHAV